MAYARKTLTLTFTRLSSRLHPSLPHLLLDDRNNPEPSTPSFSRSIHNFTSQIHNTRPLPLPLPLGLNPFFHCSFSSRAEGTSSEIEIFKDVADVITDATHQAGITASAVPGPFPGEVAAAAADSYLPVAALQYLIDGVQSFTGLHWWASIVLTTLLIRGATTPLLLNQMRSSAKLSLMRPELEELKQQMDNSMDPESIQEGQRRMKALFKKHGVTPLTPLKGMFIQAPIFISFFLAISNMVEKVPSFKEGGAFWFIDLTTPDSLYILPVLTALTFWATVELNMQEGMEGNPMAKTMKNVSRGFAVMTIPLTAHFPKAIFCYWITSNIFSLTYGFVIRRPPVRKFLNLPDIVRQPTNSGPQPNFSFLGSLKQIAGTNPLPAKESEQVKSPERRVSSSSAVGQRIRNLEKAVKSRSKVKPKKR